MPESLTVLGIESSCDETAVAILRSAGEEKLRKYSPPSSPPKLPFTASTAA